MYVPIPMKAKDAATGRHAFARELRTLPARLCRFAHPHCPWERDTNENTNGLLRHFFPKDIRFTQLSRAEIKRAQAIFNDRPRKVLTLHSSAHAFHHLLR